MLGQDPFKMFYGRRKSDGAVFRFQAGNDISFDFDLIDEATFEAENAATLDRHTATMRAAWDAARDEQIATAAAQSGIPADTLKALLSVPR